jgi:hypothetical protein
LRAAVIALATATGLACAVPAYAIPVFDADFGSSPAITFTSDAAAYRAHVLAAEQAAIAQHSASLEALHRQKVMELGYEPGTTEPREIARQMMQNWYSWGADEFACYDRIITQESRWRVTAANPHSSAYGLPQALPGKRMAAYGADWRTNPATQLAWGLNYVKTRYGTPCQAWSYKRAHGWY